MSELRPSFEERDRYLDLLSQAYGNGRLDEAEFERRSNGVLNAVTHRDAMAHFEGLPEPNIVPVTPPPPPRPQQAYQPLLDPRTQASSSDVTRRTLLGVGVGVGLLALVGMFGITAGVDYSSGEFPDVDEYGVPFEEFSLTMDEIFVDGVQQAVASLDEQGLSHVEEFFVSKDRIQGLAAPADGGDLVGFSQEPRGPLSTSETSRAAGTTVDVGRLEAMVPRAIDMSTGQLFGDVSTIELRWDRSGEPLIRVTATDEHRTGLVDVSEFGEVVHWEESP